jgi:hypothetical protein
MSAIARRSLWPWVSSAQAVVALDRLRARSTVGELPLYWPAASGGALGSSSRPQMPDLRRTKKPPIGIAAKFIQRSKGPRFDQAFGLHLQAFDAQHSKHDPANV